MVNARMVALGITAGALGIFMAGTAALGGAQAGSSSAAGTESGERTIEDGGTGPYKAIAVSNSSIATHTIYRPKDLSAFGDREKLPILAWGNGGCANSNTTHQNYLSEIASHGYLIVAIGPNQAGGGRGGPGAGGPGAAAPAAGTPVPSGGTLLEAINWATAQNANPQSPYYRKIDTAKVAVFGHSCGGLQALEIAPDPRVKTVLVVDSGILNSPGAAPGAGAAPRGAAGPGGAAAGGAPAGAGRGAPGGAAGGGNLPGMPPLRRSTLRNFTPLCFFFWAERPTLRTPTAWMISSASKSFLSSLPTRASATAEHSPSPTAATGRWLQSHGCSGNSRAMRKRESFLLVILRDWPGWMAGRSTRKTSRDGTSSLGVNR